MTELSLTAVLEHYGADLTRVAPTGWRTMRCPFHGDSHASGRVNLENGAYRCHGCAVHGDAINTIARAEGFGTPEHPDRGRAIDFAQRELGASFAGLRQPAKGKPRKQRWRDRLID